MSDTALPEAWSLVQLGTLGTFLKGSGIRKDEAQSGEIPAVRYGELYTDHQEILRAHRSFISEDVSKTARPIRHGDILFAGSGETKEEIGKCTGFLGDYEAFAGGDIIIFRPSGADPRFLAYLLNSRPLAQQKAQRAQGDAVVHIYPDALSALRLPLPPLHEQQAIAAALSDADGVVAGLERVIAKKRLIKQGAMQDLLTARRRLPGFSGEWEVKMLGNHVRFLKNGTHSRAQLSDNGPVKNLHYGDIHGASSVTLSPATTPMPTLDQVAAGRLDRLTSGDLVFVDASEDLAGVGTSVEILNMGEVEVVSGLHTIAARFDKSVLVDGFKALLQFIPEFRSHLCQLAAGTKVLATNRRHIATAEIALPPPAEQQAIAAVLADMGAEIQTLESRLAKARAVKEGMMQNLLTGRVRLV
jgi:type I restriction enzyme S subunit